MGKVEIEVREERVIHSLTPFFVRGKNGVRYLLHLHAGGGHEDREATTETGNAKKRSKGGGVKKGAP
jgi:hypothetical protein